MTFREDQSDQLISAYLDGDLTPEEQNRAEQLLATSADHQRLQEELLALRSSMQSLPRLSLGAGFKERVIQRAESELLAQRGRPYGSPDRAVQKSPRLSRQNLLRIVAALAALLLIGVGVVLWSINSDQGGITNLDRPTGGPEYGISQVKPDKEDEQKVKDLRPQAPMMQYFLVYDLALTEQGYEKMTFDALLARSLIRADNSIDLTGQLEQSLLNSRFLAGTVKAENREEKKARRETEVVYVVATGEQFVSLWKDLAAHPDEIAGYRFDLASSQVDMNMMAKLDRESIQHRHPLTAAERVVATLGRAQRLIFSVALRNTAAPSYISLAPRSATNATNRDVPLVKKDPVVPMLPGVLGGNETYRVLFVLRPHQPKAPQ